ncbi:hypothetical protein FGE12_20780 [Aggregicoccus sp. 17bor-14]|uniref:hypothetical protein n=1 Tax=Myxococcaceae TaxID=31 RepID=UPI00129D06B5|nr:MULTISPECIES: hypothetical protein [Myxococcaceae]MBF5044847.1 hypothetical protein [Simulacricoccus sp. 17bor-14]MRI90591.1 hypothetical protein [Aggregicoccus sp. 17bor-14]
MAKRSEQGSAGSSSSGFDRDFGYLMPFLDRVAQAAAGLQDPAARAELQRLMAEEKGRWARVRELLAGAQGRAGAAGASAPGPRARPGAPAPRQPGAQLTVGSLKSPR